MNNGPEYDYLQFDHDFQPWWQRRWGRWTLMGIVLAAVAGVVLAKPAWQAFLRWRADRYAGQGEAFLREGRLSEAYDRAHQALELNPQAFRQLRLMAEVMAQAEASSGLQYWRRLLAMPSATIDQRQGMVAFALDLESTQEAEVPLRELLAATNPPVRTWFLAARFHALLNDATNAVRCAREVARGAATAPSDALRLAGILAAHPEPACRREAVELRWRVARGDGPSRWDALEALVLDGDDPRLQCEEVVKLLTGLSPRELRAEIILADARMRLDRDRARDIALEMLARMKPETDEDHRLVQRWLHRHELFGRAVETLGAARARQDLDLMRFRLAAMVGIGQTAAAYREILRPNPALSPLDQELDRYHLATVLKDTDGAANHQRRVVELAQQDSVKLRQVAEYAEAHGLVEFAVSMWKAVAGDRLETRRALRSLTALTDGTGDTWGAREAARKWALLEPEDVKLSLRIAHYDLLLGENLAAALSTADGLVDHPSAGREARFVAALANVRLGRQREARSVLPDRLIVGQTLRPDLRSIGVAVLGGSGERERARSLAASLALEKLRPEERELIRAYLPGAGASPAN